MATMRLVIKYVNEPKPGKNRGSIKGTENEFFGVPQALLRLFEVGKTYDVTYTENGEWKTVTGASEAQVAAVIPMAGKPAAAPSNGGAYRETCAKDAERMFVCATLVALIKAGEVKNDKRALWETTNLLRGLWGATFGEGNTFCATEAGPRSARG